MNEIKTFRNMNNVPVCFTLDAGANVHVLYPEKDSKSVKILSMQNFQNIVFKKIHYGSCR